MKKYQELRKEISRIEGSDGEAKFYSRAIFRHTSWFIARYDRPEVVHDQVRRSSIVESPRKNEVLESLAKRVEESGPVASKFGSIVKSDKEIFPGSKLKLEADISAYQDRVESVYLDFKFNDYANISTLIVGERIVDELNHENKHIKTRHDSTELLGKMIIPMKLEEGEFARSALIGESDDEILQNLLCEIALLRPKVVISLGAVATNFLYGKKEKLSKVHGSEMERTVESDVDSFSFTLFPIFHPDLLEINPSMKRTAWIDLQKVMKFLGKL